MGVASHDSSGCCSRKQCALDKIKLDEAIDPPRDEMKVGEPLLF